jgi:hypothetical protein
MKDEKIKAGKGTGATGTAPTPPIEPKEPKGDKKIEVSEGLLRKLIASNKELQNKVDKLDSNAVATGPNGVQVRRKATVFKPTMSKWDGHIFLAYENMGTEKRPLYVYNVYDEKERKNIQYVNLILDGVDKPVKVDYLTFLRDRERIIVTKISESKKQDVKEDGYIPKKEMAENGYGMFETMVMVPVEVTTDHFTYVVKLPEDEGGKELEVDEQAFVGN